MQNIQVNYINLIIPVSIGEITQLKKEVIEEILKNDDFQIIKDEQDGKVIGVKNEENILITNDRISYVKKCDEIKSIEIEHVFELLIKKLMMDENNFAMIEVQGISKSKNSHVDSVRKFKNKFKDSINDKNVYGIGYRFLTKDDKHIGEFKFEPLIRDSNYYYHEVIISFNKIKVNYHDVINKLQYIINNIDEYYLNIN